jgi:DNA-binding beta-propeller fold protein YncE
MKSLLYVFVAVGAIAFGQSDTAITLVPGRFVPLGLRNTTGRSLATDDSGNFYIAGVAQSGGQVAKIDPNGKVLYSKSVAGSPLGIAVDKTGSSYIVGAASTGTIFCTKLSPDGSSIVFSTLLGMGEADAVAVDSSGSAYVTGRVISGMASTPGAFQTALHGPDAFVTKLGPDGKVVFTTFLGGNGPACNPGGSCRVGLFGGVSRAE